MRTKRVLGCMAAMTFALQVGAQDWNTNGNTINGGEWFGAAAGSTVPLRMETRVNQPIEWWTDASRRMFLSQTLVTQTLGTYTNLDLSGHLGIGRFGSINVDRPFTLLHVDNGGTQFSGFRPWQKTGMTLTQVSDMAYLGMKFEGNDRNHLTLCWADNDMGFDGPDRLKLIFLAQPIAANGTAGTLNGLEAARVTPAGSGNESFFGIGDWFTQGGNADPDERLDLLDRTIRIRRLIPDHQSNSLDHVVVADADGRLHWRDASTLGGADCDWEVSAAGDVLTAYDPLPPAGCPGEVNMVGIGSSAPAAKLQVDKTQNTTLGIDETAVLVRTVTTGNENYGVRAETSGGTDWNTAIQGSAFNALRNFGLRGLAEQPAQSNWGAYARARHGSGNNVGLDAQGVQGGHARGVIGTAVLGSGSNVGVTGVAIGSGSGVTYGVLGQATGAGPVWAGYFVGDVFSTGTYQGSDAALKTNLTPLGSSLGIIEQLQPVRFTYNQIAVGSIGCPPGDQAGFIAQDVQTVLPHLVRPARSPMVLDSLGNEIGPSHDFLSVNYTGLIPYLVAGMQEQLQMVEQLQQQLTQLQQQLAQCCAATSPVDGRGMQPMGTPDGGPGDQRLRIQPNPFGSHTTVVYTLERAAQVRLEVADEQGRLVRVLRQGAEPAGEQRVEWPTGQLAPGTYLVRLVVDGTPQVERAVKW